MSWKNSNSNWRGRISRYAPLVLWVGVIFFASSTAGSMSNTSRFIRPLLEFLFPNSPEETLLLYHGSIRKFAHFAEYAILAFWASRAFWSSSAKFTRKYWFLASFVLALLVASTDEYNQSLNSIRSGSIYDVLIDLSGVVFMIILIITVRSYNTTSKEGKSVFTNRSEI